MHQRVIGKNKVKNLKEYLNFTKEQEKFYLAVKDARSFWLYKLVRIMIITLLVIVAIEAVIILLTMFTGKGSVFVVKTFASYSFVVFLYIILLFLFPLNVIQSFFSGKIVDWGGLRYPGRLYESRDRKPFVTVFIFNLLSSILLIGSLFWII